MLLQCYGWSEVDAAEQGVAIVDFSQDVATLAQDRQRLFQQLKHADSSLSSLNFADDRPAFIPLELEMPGDLGRAVDSDHFQDHGWFKSRSPISVDEGCMQRLDDCWLKVTQDQIRWCALARNAWALVSTREIDTTLLNELAQREGPSQLPDRSL